MIKISSKNLPHAISISDIKDVQLKDKALLLKENIESVHSRLTNVEKAVIETQQNKTTPKETTKDESGSGNTEESVNIEELETLVAETRANAAQTSEDKNTVVQYSIFAANSKRSAEEYANSCKSYNDSCKSFVYSASTNASTAKRYKEKAEEIKNDVEKAASVFDWSTSFVLSYATAINASYVNFPMSAFVNDTEATYKVKVTFVCNYNSTGTSVRYFTLNEKQETCNLSNGNVVSIEDNVSGDSSLKIINGAGSATATAGSTQWVTILNITKVQEVNNG